MCAANPERVAVSLHEYSLSDDIHAGDRRQATFPDCFAVVKPAGDLRKESEELRGKVSRVESTIPDRLRNEFYRIYKQRQQVAVRLTEANLAVVGDPGGAG